MDKKELYELIQKKHLKNIKNADITNENKLAILFSGVPGSGKTYLAKKIEKRYKALRWSNEVLREIIYKLPENYLKEVDDNPYKVFKIKSKNKLNKIYLFGVLQIKKENLFHDYLKFILKNYPFRNNLIVFDKSVDRSYKIFKDFSKKSEFKLFLIKLPFNKELIRKRVIDRGEGNMTFFDKNLPRWKRDYDKLNKNIKADFIYKDNLKDLFDKLDKSFLAD